jgi:hypothetical protein
MIFATVLFSLHIILPLYEDIRDAQPRLDPLTWHNVMLRAALRERKFALDGPTQVIFDDYNIDVTVVDFDGDGVDEYLLKVRHDLLASGSGYEGYNYLAYHIAYRNPSGDLVVTGTPLGASYIGIPYWIETIWEAQPLQDINADGQIEWIVVEYGDNAGPGGWAWGFLRIFAWRNHQLTDLAPDDFGFGNNHRQEMGWEWRDANADGILEFSMSVPHQNSWGCYYATLHEAEWSPTTARYEYTHITDSIPRSLGCIVTEAEAAMWREDFALAADLYAQAHQHASAEAPGDYRALAIYQYSQLRLALAYRLLGRIADARTIIDDLQEQQPGSEGVGQLIEAVSTVRLDQDDDLSLCVAMHDFFLGSYRDFSFYVGYTHVDSEMFAGKMHSRPDPARAGCNLDAAIRRRLGDAPFRVEQRPSERFAAANVTIRSQFNVDLNGDGVEDWLIFPELRLSPFVFIANRMTQQFAMVRIPSSWNAEFEVEVMAGPDEGRPLLHYVAWDTLDPTYYQLRCADMASAGLYRIWRFDEGQLIPIFNHVVCERASLQTIVRESGRALYFWPEGACSDRPTFLWDTESGRYTQGDVSCFIETPF